LAAGITRVKGVKQLGFRSGNWLSAETESERTIATRLVVEGRTEVDEARTRFDSGGLADNDIHRLVRVTAQNALVYLRSCDR
jgi:hypothetical protein